MGSSQLWGHCVGPPLLPHGWQQRGLQHAARLQEPHQHLPWVVQIQGNTVVCRDDGSEPSVLSTGGEGRGTGKVTQEKHGTEGPAELAWRGYVGWKAKLINAIETVNGSRKEGWGMDYRAERAQF